MKRVLFVAHSGNISGGANRSLLSIIETLKADYDIEPFVLMPKDGCELLEKCKEIGIDAFVANYHGCCTVYERTAKDILRFIKLFIAPSIDKYRAIKLSKALPREFDLVYTNERMIAIGAYLAKIWKVPHIWHIRSFSKENKTVFPLGWTGFMKNNSNRIVLISKALYDSFAKEIHEDKLCLIHNGVEAEKYEVYKKEPHDGFNILLSGRITRAKGQMEALKALDILVNERKIDARLWFAGQIPSYDNDSYYKEMIGFIKERELKERVVFLGEVDPITQIRQKMDVELVCSWCEAFGRVTVEAMLAGLPVIGTNTGGTLDIISDGLTGWLYKAGNAADLAEKMALVYNNPQIARDMGEIGKKAAKDCFSAQLCVNKIYREIDRLVLNDRYG